MSNLTFLILMGLPASGKSTFAHNQLKLSPRTTSIIDFDKWLSNSPSLALSYLSTFSPNYKITTIIIDGLVHTNSQLLDILTSLSHNPLIRNVIIHYWSESRSTCLFNDMYRRPVSSTLSINSLPLDTPDLSTLSPLFPSLNLSLVYQQVIPKPLWLLFSDKYNLGATLDSPFFKSDSWCQGGDSGSCWSNQLSRVDPQEPPSSFDSLDNFLLSTLPNLSFHLYKQLYNSCVSIGSYTERDYYGGCVSYSFYQCHIPSFFNLLVSHFPYLFNELNLLNPNHLPTN